MLSGEQTWEPKSYESAQWLIQNRFNFKISFKKEDLKVKQEY